MKKLEDFRTRHRSNARLNIVITWTSDGSKGTYESWLIEDFSLELNSTQQQLVDDWIKEYNGSANNWTYRLEKINI